MSPSTAAASPLFMVPNLRVFRQLDVDKLSDEFKEKIGLGEGNYEYVDIDRARDFPYTEEIMQTTIGAVLADAEGNILATFAGPQAWVRADRARQGARITFDINLEDEGDDEAE
jgi:hypothetical protein